MTVWLSAFLLTQAVEMPLWLAGSTRSGLGGTRTLIIAFGTSAITHPLLWFAIPWERWPYLPTIVVAELTVVAVEAFFAESLGLRRPWMWSFIANGASIAAGILTRWWFGWP